MNKSNLPYNLIKEYADSEWLQQIILQRILHEDYEIWERLSRHGIKYIESESGKYFPSNIEIIGIGSNSVIYSIKDTHKILKITNNHREIAWTKEIDSLQSTAELYQENYIRIYDIVSSEIHSNFVSLEVDATEKITFIIAEKLYQLNKDELNDIELFDDKLRIELKCSLTTDYINYLQIGEYVEDIQIADEPLKPHVIDVVNKYIQLGIDSEKYKWKDFHFNNLMKNIDNEYKFIDLQKVD